MKLERSKGTKDFLPEEQIVRQDIVSALKKVFELYGYSPLETPALERYDVLASKYAGGSEILKETFKLKDQGNRTLGLRYDLTIPLARIIGMNPQLKMPFKRYHVGDVWRDGPVGLARYRQFLQCDVDIVGCSRMTADAEIIVLTNRVFEELGLDIKITVNNRKILNDILTKLKVSKQEDAILSIDKLAKFGVDTVKKELKEKGLRDAQINELLEVIGFKGSNQQKLNRLKEFLRESQGLTELDELLTYLSAFDVDVEFDVSLARGLTYYTGTIFEVFLKKGRVESSLAAGGRYDQMIGAFIGGKDVPAVGISFGLDRVYDAYKEQKKETVKTVTRVFIIPIQTFEKSFSVAQQLREAGIQVDMDLMNRGPSKNLQYANALNIPFVVFVGEEEVKQNMVKLRDMRKGTEDLLKVEECIAKVRKFC